MHRKGLQAQRSAGRENDPPQFRRRDFQDYRSQRAETYSSIRTGKPHCDPNKNEEITRLANTLAADGSGRPFDMVKDDVLLAWQQSPHKDTLGFYGVGSPTHQPESVVFNQVVAACLVKVNGGGTQRRNSKPARKTSPRDMLAEKNHTPQICKPLVLNRQALQSDLQQIPHVQQQLDPRKAFEALYCTDSPQVTRDSTRVARQLYTGISRAQVFDMEPATRRDPRGLRGTGRHWYCPPDCLEPRLGCTQYEWAKNKLDAHPLSKEAKEHKSPESMNYDQLYSRILKFFEQNHSADPLCESYEKCCRPKRSHGKDNQVPRDPSKPGKPLGDLGDPMGKGKRETGETDKVTGGRDEGTADKGDKGDGKDRNRVNDKYKPEVNDKESDKNINNDKDIYKEKQKNKDIAKENAKKGDTKKEQAKEIGKEREKAKEKDKARENEKGKEKEKKKSKKKKDKYKETEWERGKENEYENERKKEKEIKRGREKEKEKEPEREQDKENEEEKVEEGEEKKDRERETKKEQDSEKGREKENKMEIDKEIKKEKEKEKVKEKGEKNEKEQQVKEETGKEQGKVKEREIGKEIEKEKRKENEEEKGKVFNKEQDKEKQKEREIAIYKDKDKEKDKDREKDKDAEIDREKNQEKNKDNDHDKDKNQNKKKKKNKKNEDIKNEVNKELENKKEEERERFSEERRRTQPDIPEFEKPSKRGTTVDEFEFPGLELIKNDPVAPTGKLKVPPKRKKRDRDKNVCKDKPKKTCPPCPPAGCQCEICRFMDRPYNEQEAPFMREMRRAEQRRQLRAYYRQMCHQEYIRDRRKPEYRAPKHQCDPICCSNFLCRNPRLAEHCDCLGAVQELQNLLSDAKDNEDHSKLLLRVENLRKRVCQRMCDCILG
ncbi:zinc finger CCCH domain-containing protein 13 [Drosophila erecta]|uniref:Uncharacterized protein n=1 Tax=Drosophila erecta TaxID=7220 RepID=B3NM77_DROER|nr:zinc finger CCCH domain-containing protein 13 [Drosophila erecta]EDV54677.2 uncharacterized protein Dere_GG21641 [Drosophila erecta]